MHKWDLNSRPLDEIQDATAQPQQPTMLEMRGLKVCLGYWVK